MGKDRPPSYSRSRSDDKSEYRSMTRSPSPKRKSSKSSRKKYSRSSSSSSSSSAASDNHSRLRRKGRQRGSSSPVMLQSSPERGNSVTKPRWLESSPMFQPMTPPSPPNLKMPEAPVLKPASPMESQPIPSFQREDNYRSSGAPTHGYPRNYRGGFNQGFGSDYFQSNNPPFFPPDANPQHPFDLNELPPPSSMSHGPPMSGARPPDMINSAGPPPSMVSAGVPPNMISMGQPVPSMANAGNPTPNMAAPWDLPQGNFSFSAEYPAPTPGVQLPPLAGFSHPPDVAPSHPTPSSSNVDTYEYKPNAVEQELVQQKRTLAIQREEYFKKKIAFTRDLKALKDKKRELQRDNSKGSEKLLKENLRLQDEIEEKLKSLDSVVEMLTHIIGDKNEIEQLLKETSRRSASPIKRRRSRSKSTSRSKSVKKRSPSPSKESSSPHVNVVHYDPELHWCPVCNVFPRSAAVYLVHLHSDQHKIAVKEKKEKEKTEEEFSPWRVHEKRELSPPVYKNAPSRRVPIRGVPFLVPSTAWYCSMCKMWLGDLEIATRHLRGEKHAANYSVYVTQNPHWEVDWLRDRTRAYERNSEARNRPEDYKEEKSSKKDSKKKDASELSVSDVSKLEERLMAMISANNAANSKEGSSKNKHRSKSSSRSDASYSESSDDEKKDKKKRKKNKKKKKSARESSEKLDEQDDHKKEKHDKGRKNQESDAEPRKERRRWDDDGRSDKRNNDRGGGSDRRDRHDRDDKAGKTEARDRFMNAWRGRGRGRGRAKFDHRRLINRNPLWKPSPEKLAIGRHVFGLSASEYYGPEVPPKKDNDK